MNVVLRGLEQGWMYWWNDVDGSLFYQEVELVGVLLMLRHCVELYEVDCGVVVRFFCSAYESFEVSGCGGIKLVVAVVDSHTDDDVFRLARWVVGNVGTSDE